MPKPPPTSGVVTRTAALSSPRFRASSSRSPQTPCPEKATCSRSPSHSAKQPRGSIGIAFARLSTRSSRVVCAAAAKARSTAASSPCAQSKARFSAACAWMAGPPMAVARCAGSSSRSKSISSAASSPASRLSASTIAIASPAKRTTLVGQHRPPRLGPARPVAVLHHRAVDAVLQLAREILRGEDRHHARRRRRLAHVQRAQPRMRRRAAQEHRMQRALRGRVVDETPLAGQEAPVLLAQHALAGSELAR